MSLIEMIAAETRSGCLSKSIRSSQMSMLLGHQRRTLPPETPRGNQSRSYQQNVLILDWRKL